MCVLLLSDCVSLRRNYEVCSRNIPSTNRYTHKERKIDRLISRILFEASRVSDFQVLNVKTILFF